MSSVVLILYVLESFEDLQQFIKTSDYHFVLMKVSFEELQQFCTLCLNSTKDFPSFHFAPGKYICSRQVFYSRQVYSLQASIFAPGKYFCSRQVYSLQASIFAPGKYICSRQAFCSRQVFFPRPFKAQLSQLICSHFYKVKTTVLRL